MVQRSTTLGRSVGSGEGAGVGASDTVGFGEMGVGTGEGAGVGTLVGAGKIVEDSAVVLAESAKTVKWSHAHVTLADE